MDDEVSERDIALETFRQTRAMKWLLAALLGVVLVVLAINAAEEEEAHREACTDARIQLTLTESPAARRALEEAIEENC